MPRLLLVQHCPTAATRRLGDAVLAGARHPDLEGVVVVVREALDATADDVLAANAVVLGTPANFGYMSGALKHFFDRSFLALGGALDADGSGSTGPASGPRVPWALWVHGNYDTVGAVRSVESLVAALPWRRAAPPLALTGEVTEDHEARAFELGATLAALTLEDA
ncbi:flavodoxin family protein [Nocardioides yefusunii]|uniref:Flavodoxin family protein n=1 Tax=Nocardioides yefusunii TaxID=2500546 RepID=A0ABW1QYJ8_9ACTN|nr:NAD(P)H-dependent oxidoreductase [Nocardioides yefusunii]